MLHITAVPAKHRQTSVIICAVTHDGTIDCDQFSDGWCTGRVFRVFSSLFSSSFFPPPAPPSRPQTTSWRTATVPSALTARAPERAIRGSTPPGASCPGTRPPPPARRDAWEGWFSQRAATTMSRCTALSGLPRWGYLFRGVKRGRPALSGPICHHFDRIELDLRGHTHVRGAALSCLRLKWADIVLI